MKHMHVSDHETYAQVVTKKLGDEIRIHCPHCENDTYHKIMAHVRCIERQNYYDEPYEGLEPGGGDSVNSVDFCEDFYTIQCGGCRKVSVYLTQVFSEDDGWMGTKLFPIEPTPSRQLFDSEGVLPPKVARIYNEAVKALDSQLPVLAGVGIRAVLETVCKECDAKGRDLEKRIDAMVEKGLITKDGAGILHSLRILGNAAAHDVEPHSLGELNAAFDVIDHLLQGVYTIPARAKELPQKK
ncbi:MAG: DUF4145 domain-containing protein [Proteobacteria bacterium]|nr:DUF4145 domain-containing protein [Pseudomonadota bacterium]MBU1595484.1 DUF4145 domain-containing protein [Pseudomonadota bacterium]